MTEDLLSYFDKCRCCLTLIDNDEQVSQISKQRFFDVLQIEVDFNEIDLKL